MMIIVYRHAVACQQDGWSSAYTVKAKTIFQTPMLLMLMEFKALVVLMSPHP